jgi:hypothetical protein
MTRRLLGLAQLPLLATVALMAAVVFVPGRKELALHVYLLVLATLALAWLVRLVRRAHPVAAASPFDLGLRERVEHPARLPELARLEREVSLATNTAFDLHFRLRPVLRRITAQLLAARRGVDLDGDPEAARGLLGEEAWEVVRPEREAPRDRSGPGIDLSSLRAIVASLEAL